MTMHIPPLDAALDATLDFDDLDSALDFDAVAAEDAALDLDGIFLDDEAFFLLVEVEADALPAVFSILFCG